MAINFIEMYHPEMDRTVRVSDKAFDQVWSKKGWVRITEDEGAGDESSALLTASELLGDEDDLVVDDSDEELETDD